MSARGRFGAQGEAERLNGALLESAACVDRVVSVNGPPQLHVCELVEVLQVGPGGGCGPRPGRQVHPLLSAGSSRLNCWRNRLWVRTLYPNSPARTEAPPRVVVISTRVVVASPDSLAMGESVVMDAWTISIVSWVLLPSGRRTKSRSRNSRGTDWSNSRHSGTCRCNAASQGAPRLRFHPLSG